MRNNLKEKLENLSSSFRNDLDVISLKALCAENEVVNENEQIQFAINNILERLVNKYPNNKEILNLLSEKEMKENISLEELIEIIEEKYPHDAEVITIKALYNSLDERKEEAIEKCLERLLELNSEDEDILNYLRTQKLLKNCLLNWANNICLTYEKKREEEGNPVKETEKFDPEIFADSPVGRTFAFFGKRLAERINEKLENERQKELLKKEVI